MHNILYFCLNIFNVLCGVLRKFVSKYMTVKIGILKLLLLNFMIYVVLAHDIKNVTCSSHIQGSTVMDRYHDYYLNFTNINKENGYIIIDACSPFTTYDILLKLYDKNKQQILTFCDDICNDTCKINNKMNSKLPIWSINMNDLPSKSSLFILNINGYHGITGQYSISIYYPCHMNVRVLALKKKITYITPNIDGIFRDITSVKQSFLRASIITVLVLMFLVILCGVTSFMYLGSKSMSELLILVVKLFMVVLQAFIAITSIICALALSNLLGFDTTLNGLFATYIGSLGLILSIIKFMASILLQLKDKSLDKNVLRLLLVTVYVSTVDSAFDIIQGMSVIKCQPMDGIPGMILIFTSWFGVCIQCSQIILSIIDNCFQMRYDLFPSIFHYLFCSVGMIHNILGIYLLFRRLGCCFCDTYVIIGNTTHFMFLLSGAFLACMSRDVREQMEMHIHNNKVLHHK